MLRNRLLLLLLLLIFIGIGCSSLVQENSPEEYIEITKPDCSISIYYNGLYQTCCEEHVANSTNIKNHASIVIDYDQVLCKITIADGKKIVIDKRNCKVIKNEPNFRIYR